MKIIISILITSCIICGQSEYENEKSNIFADYQLSSERYVTKDDGSVWIKVNIWGHVGSPGSHLVYDGIDFASLLSLVGGPKDGADLKKVRLYREVPDDNEQLVYDVNLNEFIKTGNRSNFIKIKPNDTVIIPQKIGNVLLTQIGTINTIFSLVTIYLQIQYLSSR